MIRAWLAFALQLAILAYNLREASLLAVLAVALFLGAGTGAVPLLIDMYIDRRQRRREQERERERDKED